jgi:hypothetical protein
VTWKAGVVTIAVAPVESHFNRGDVVHLVSRVVAVTSNEIVRNDIETFLEVNRQLLIDGTQRWLRTSATFRSW